MALRGRDWTGWTSGTEGGIDRTKPCQLQESMSDGGGTDGGDKGLGQSKALAAEEPSRVAFKGVRRELNWVFFVLARAKVGPGTQTC